jgi:hypothetical protein
MLVPEICREHASLLYIVASAPTLAHVPFVATIVERIIISNYSYNKICHEHTVDMLLPLNIIDELLITRFVDIKRVQYKYFTHLRTYHCLISSSSNNDHMIEQINLLEIIWGHDTIFVSEPQHCLT